MEPKGTDPEHNSPRGGPSVCYQGDDSRADRYAYWETEATAGNYLLERFEYSRILQLRRGICCPAGSEGEGREKKVIYSLVTLFLLFSDNS